MPLLFDKPILIYMNPMAGSARAVSREAIAAEMAQLGLPYTWVSLMGLKRLAAGRKQHHFVLVVGGDGTLHAAINAIGYQNLNRFSFGIIPAGTGNDFARSLNIPLGIQEAFGLLQRGMLGKVDLGVMNRRICFTCAFSLGFGPEVTKNATRGLKSLLGRGAFYWGAISYLLKPKPLNKLKTKINRHETRYLYTPHLVIGNGKYHGGGFPISPQAHLQNALLDLYYLKPIRLWRLPKLVYRFFRNKKNHTVLEEVVHEQIQEIEIDLEKPMEVDIDGDLYWFYRNIHIQILPQHLQVLMPSEAVVLNQKPVKYAPWQFMSRKRRAS